MARRSGLFLQEARKRMEKKGTVGSFGKATPKKISAGLKKGGKAAKKAAFAKAIQTINRRRRARGRQGRRRSR